MLNRVTFRQDAPDTVREDLRARLAGLEASGSGYQSWGSVQVICLAVRLQRHEWTRIYMSEDHREQLKSILEAQRPDRQLESIIFRKRRKINVILYTHQQNASLVSKTIPPILDDQAQLLGPSLRCCGKVTDPKKIYRALKGRYAVNLEGGPTICLGKSLEDAYVAAQLVEKTSKAVLSARALGGAKPINRLEAWAMHKFYMLKYSRESEKNR